MKSNRIGALKGALVLTGISVRLWTLLAIFAAGFVNAQEITSTNYKLAAGDEIRIAVFQNPDLNLETSISQSGDITFPLIGRVQVGGKTLEQAGQEIAWKLSQGGYVKRPQVNISLLQVRGNQVSVLGEVNRPGRFPLEILDTRLADVLSLAGGIAVTGADTVIVSGTRDNKPFQKEIDFPAIFIDGDHSQNIVISGGDVVYVHRAPVFYIYGEVQRPGAYRVERGMTVQQALAQGGGVTPRGTESGIRLHRKNGDGKVLDMTPKGFDKIQANDVLYIRESIF